MSAYLDTRDLNERLSELQAAADTLTAAREELANLPDDTSAEERAAIADSVTQAEAAHDESDAEELAELRDLADEIGSEWRHGVTLIPESEFEDYARELAEDIGALKDCDHWPATCIDWERAARELAADYSTCEYRGVSYYYQS